RMKGEPRFHCNACNISFSATVNTVFHNTRIPLEKWFGAIVLLFERKKPVSARALASEIQVNKNTAWQMLVRIKESLAQTCTRVSEGLNPEALFREIEEKVNPQKIDILQLIVKKLLEVNKADTKIS
ncbi:MAG: hypothetical protein JXR21_00305, partial [Candidatus Marinimicrobia bacterium]|nr:hypothetical protein [Candidatus Neomarinimicrobiota bacterium]